MNRLGALCCALLVSLGVTQLVALPGARATEVPSALVLDSPTGGDYGRTSRTYVSTDASALIQGGNDGSAALYAERTVAGQHQSDSVRISPPAGTAITPGSYDTFAGDGSWQVWITHDGSGGCASKAQPATLGTADPGSLVIRDAQWDGGGALTVLDADFTFSCEGRPVTHGQLRFHSATPFTALETDTPSVPHGVPSGITSPVSGFVMRNTGTTPLTVSSVSLAGDDTASGATPLAEWGLGAETCTSTPVPVGGSCSVSLSLTPAATGPRRVIVHLVDDTVGGAHDTLVSVLSKRAPDAAVHLQTTNEPSVPMVVMNWNEGSIEQSQAADSYRVLRGPSPDALSPVGGGDAPSGVFIDNDYTIGVRYYAVELTNVAGTSRSDSLRVEIGRGAVTRLAASGLARRVGFAWSPPSTYWNTAVTGYVVYSGVSPKALTTTTSLPASQPFFSVRNVVPGVAVYARVVPMYGSTAGPWSPIVSAVAGTAQLVAVDDLDRLVAMPIGGGTGIPYATPNLASFATPAVSRDGRWIAFSAAYATSDSYNRIFVVPGDGSGQPVKRADNYDDYEPTFSPDGLTIVYTSYDYCTCTSKLFRVGRSSGNPVLIPNSTNLVSPAFLGTSATTLVASAPLSTPARLIKLTLAGTRTALWSDNPGKWYDTAVSLDGKRVAFVAGDGGGVYVRATAGGSVLHVAPLVGDFASPRFSLDGATLYFAHRDSATGTSDVWSVPSSGGTAKRLTSGSPNELGVAPSYPDYTAPAVRITAPTATSTSSTSVKVAWLPTDAQAGVLSSDVRYRRAKTGGSFGSYVIPSGWAGTTLTAKTLTVGKGYRYCFSVRSRDRDGNTSGWTAERCISVV